MRNYVFMLDRHYFGSLVSYFSNDTLCTIIRQEMGLSGEFESLQESVKSAKMTPFIIWMYVRGEIFVIRLGLFYAIEFDPKGVTLTSIIIWERISQLFTRDSFLWNFVYLYLISDSISKGTLHLFYNWKVLCVH